jgi:hypothetical protein
VSTGSARAGKTELPASGSHTWRASKAVHAGSAKAAERPRFCRKHRLLHPREKRSALHFLGELGFKCSRICLIRRIAAETLPCPIAPCEPAQIVVSFECGRPSCHETTCWCHLNPRIKPALWND